MNAALSTSPTESADAVLLDGIRARDERAYEQLVRIYGPRMQAVAQRLMRSEHDAADALQDALLSVFNSIDSFEENSRLSTWLHRVVVNACLMRLRSKKSRPTTAIEDLLPTYDDTGHRVEPVRTWSDDTFERVEKDELRAQVRTCIGELPEMYRQVLMLRDIEELDTEETAKLLGCTAGNVKTRLHRARRALRTILEKRVIQ